MVGNQMVLYEEKDGVGVITINNPTKMNALSQLVCDGVVEIVKEFGEANKIRAIILTGSGKSFVAGADIDEFPKEGIGNGRIFVKRTIEFFKCLEKSNKPIIAAVNGLALGGGSEVALYCDIVIASEKAVFGFPETGLGLVPAFAILRLHQTVGRHKAKELIMTGDMIKAEEAMRLGFVNQVVPQDKLMDAAFAVANKIKEKGPLAIEITKTSINRKLGGEDFNYMVDALSMFFGSGELKEGMAAFLEKRKPNFRG